MQVEQHIRLISPGLKGTWLVNQLKVHPLVKVMVSDVNNLHPYTAVADHIAFANRVGALTLSERNAGLATKVKAAQLALIFCREGGITNRHSALVHRYIQRYRGTLRALSEHAVTNQSHIVGGPTRRCPSGDGVWGPSSW